MIVWDCEYGHLWEMLPGKVTRCQVCRKPVLPWHRRWRNRARTRLSIIQGTVRGWVR